MKLSNGGPEMTRNLSNDSLIEMDRQAHMHGNTSIDDLMHGAGPTVMERGKGCMVYDINGKEYLDACAGLWSANIGYGRSDIADVAKQAIEQMGFWHTFGNVTCPSTTMLADRVKTLINENTNADIARIIFGLSGSDANDTNFKLIKLYNNLRGKPNKKKIISRNGAYHGLTWAASALTDIPAYHKGWDVPVDQVIRTKRAHYFRDGQTGESEEAYADRLIEDLKQTIANEGADNIAAFLAEPISGTGGVLIPPKTYFEKLQLVLEENDILLWVDEVITGFGRLGSWFGSGYYDIKPDFMTFAKGLTSSMAPLSASAISSRVWDVLADASKEYGPIMHGFTYGGHQVSTAIALKNLEIVEQEGLVDNAANIGQYLRNKISEATADNPFVGDVRGVGAMIGIEYVADKFTDKRFVENSGAQKIVMSACVQEGVLIRALPYVLPITNISPPLNLTHAEADEIVVRYMRALDRAEGDLAALAKEKAE